MDELFLSPMTIWPIIKFDADYVILDKIGEGKFGEVYKTEDCRELLAYNSRVFS
jgi:hypothetical protein